MHTLNILTRVFAAILHVNRTPSTKVADCSQITNEEERLAEIETCGLRGPVRRKYFCSPFMLMMHPPLTLQHLHRYLQQTIYYMEFTF